MSDPGSAALRPAPRGLSGRDVADRVRSGRVNKVERPSEHSALRILGRNFITPFNAVLAASSLALFAIDANADALFLSGVTVLNALLSIVGELRAKLALDRIALLRRERVTAIRDGSEVALSPDQLVEDDLVVLRAGDQVVVDGILVFAHLLYVNESLITGEADPLEKGPGQTVLSGSYCVSGEGMFRASRVGADSRANRIVSETKVFKIRRTPMQNAVNRIIQIFTAIMIFLVALLLMSHYTKEQSLATSILAIATVIKALVPEGLVLVVTLAFALSAIRIAMKQVLAQNVSAIESLCHLSTLCLDKTGTLGTNRLLFESLVPVGASEEDVVLALRRFAGAVTTKNQTILAIEGRFGSLPSEAVSEQPFSSEKKRSSVEVRCGGSRLSYWLGAPEALPAAKFSSEQEILLRDLRSSGLRVLALAVASSSHSEEPLLSLMAFLALRDELRPDVAQAIRFYNERGVKLKVLSGDHPETVAALARQVGFLAGKESWVSGRSLSKLSPTELADALQKGRVFGALSPEQKRLIVQHLQQSGEYVGMVGDGINDVLALKQANIGIALNSGAAAARDVADLVLLKDAFTFLPAASQEGDRAVYNIKRVSRLFVTKNVYSLLFILFVGFIGLEFPLSPRYVTWIDFITITLPTGFLTLMSPEVERQSARGFVEDVLRFAAAAGVVISICSLLVYASFDLLQDRGSDYGKTAAVSAIVLIGLFVVFAISTFERKTARSGQRRGMECIIAGGLIFHVIAIYLPAARSLFGFVALEPGSWVTISIVSVVGMAVLAKWFAHGRRHAGAELRSQEE